MKEMEKGKKLAEAHWAYIKGLIEETMKSVSGDHSEYIETIGFHYKTSFIHGYGHGVEDTIDRWENAGGPTYITISDMVTDKIVTEINPGIENKGDRNDTGS